MTPRQQLVNLMYLILLAMVAIDVPDSLLNSFKTIDDSLRSSVQKADAESSAYLVAYKNTKLKNDPARAKIWYDKATQASKITKSLSRYIDSIRDIMIAETGGYDEETQDVRDRQNTSITYRFFVKQNNATKLKQRIEKAKTELKNLFPANEREKLAIKPDTKGVINPEGKMLNWERRYFGNETPVTAAITTLSLLRLDVANTENFVVKKLLGRLDEAVINLDRFVAVATAPSSYVLAGQPYQASVFLSSYDSQQKAAVRVNGQNIPVVNGIGQYHVSTGRPGIYSWTGAISVKQANGLLKTYVTPPQTYQVAKPSVTIAAEKLNVVYAGIANPLAIAAAGIPQQSLQVRVNGKGSISYNGTSYLYKVDASGIGSKVDIVVTGQVDGKTVNLGTQQFRIKRIKDAVAKIAGKSTGSLSAVTLRNQNFIFAVVEDFDFDIKYKITRFSLTVINERRELRAAKAVGADFNADVRAVLAQATAGSKVIFDQIFAIGPDGTERLLNPIIINVN